MVRKYLCFLNALQMLKMILRKHFPGVIFWFIPLFLFGVKDKSNDPCGETAGSEDIPLSRDCGDNLVLLDDIRNMVAMKFWEAALATKLL